MGNPADVEEDSNRSVPTVFIVGTLTVVVVLAAAVSFYYFYWRKRPGRGSKDDGESGRDVPLIASAPPDPVSPARPGRLGGEPLLSPGPSASEPPASPSRRKILNLDAKTVAKCLAQGLRVGQGAFGEVFACKHRGRVVALKRIGDEVADNDKALKEFKDEMSILTKLDHPNVIAIYGCCTEPNALCYVCEFAERGSLFDVLHKKRYAGKLTWQRRMQIALDSARGMLFLHDRERKIVHRDLKSMNILIFKDWTAKIADFGVFREQKHTFLSTQSTGGSPAWLAPEALRGERVTESVDVYSFGVILWELVTLEKPWKQLTSLQQLITLVGLEDQRLALPNPWPERCPSIVRELIEGCFTSVPSERPGFPEIVRGLERAKAEVDAAAAV